MQFKVNVKTSPDSPCHGDSGSPVLANGYTVAIISSNFGDMCVQGPWFAYRFDWDPNYRYLSCATNSNNTIQQSLDCMENLTF